MVLILLASLYLWFWAFPVGVNNYINKVTFQMIMRSPESISYLGVIENSLIDFHSGKLDNYDKQSEQQALQHLRDARSGLDAYGPEGLEGQELLSWKITAWYFDNLIRTSDKDYANYRVNQISGVMVSMPRFLTDQHRIINLKSSHRYLSRLREFSRVIGEVHQRVVEDRDKGIVPPDFIIQKSLIGMRAFIEGGAGVNPLVTTFEKRLEAVADITAERKDELISEATATVADQILPEYEKMIALFEALLPLSDHHAGIWRLPNGDTVYTHALKSRTTSDLSAEEIHQLGLSEVARLESEMEGLLENIGLTEGSLVNRINLLMGLPEHNFANTDKGRAEQIAYLESINDAVMAIAANFFTMIPPQPLQILRVPIYSQDSAPGGYYHPPALDGSIPGRFYINQKNTMDNPRWTLPTLMYHEGAPGHHFQLSTAQLIEDVPFIRKLSPFTAYTEGWALYAERLVYTDMGVYDQDPLGNLGRLQAEMFRAVRLVVDTGMHAKRWSRERAIDYMLAKTGMTEAEVTREIERYVVWPGQATAYKVGQLALLRLRNLAEEQLGESFDLKQFHRVVLLNGAMPLEVLEFTIVKWIEDTKSHQP